MLNGCRTIIATKFKDITQFLTQVLRIQVFLEPLVVSWVGSLGAKVGTNCFINIYKTWLGCYQGDDLTRDISKLSQKSAGGNLLGGLTGGQGGDLLTSLRSLASATNITGNNTNNNKKYHRFGQ